VGDLLNTADLDQVRASGALLARLQDTLAAYPDADQLPALAVSSEPLTARVTGWLDSCAGHLPTVGFEPADSRLKAGNRSAS
jgi:homoserine kinase type II